MPPDSTKLDGVVLVNMVRFSRIGARCCASACPISCADKVYETVQVLIDVVAVRPDNL